MVQIFSFYYSLKQCSLFVHPACILVYLIRSLVSECVIFYIGRKYFVFYFYYFHPSFFQK
jgi:hypothetical protein